MMNKIEIDKERDLGEIIKDSILFFRQNFSKLFKAYLLYAGPFVLVASYFLYIYQNKFIAIFLEIMNKSPKNPDPEVASIFYSTYFTIMITFAVICTFVSYVFNEYILNYKDSEEPIEDVSFIWNNMGKKIFRLLSIVLFSASISFLGLSCLCVPGLFFAISLSSVFIISVFKNVRLFEMVSESFKLNIKHWWSTLGLILITGIIFVFASSLISIPASLINGIDIKNPNPEAFEITTNKIIVNIIVNLISSFFMGIVYIALTLHYFSINKKINNSRS